MNAKLIELAERRATLAAKAAAQREELSQALAHWRAPISAVDQGWAALRYLGKNPVVLGGAVAFLVALRPWRMAKWVPPGWLLWRIARIALRTKGVIRGFKSSGGGSLELGNTQTSGGARKEQG